MPPLVYLDESSGSGSGSEDEIPFKDPKANVPEKEAEGEAGEQGGSGEEVEAEEEYVVEDIRDHMLSDEGIILYQVKWLGWDKKEDMTWEPEDNLSGAKEALDAYYKKIGGRPSLPAKKGGKGRKRKHSEDAANAAGIGSSDKRGRRRKKTTSDEEDTPRHKMPVRGKKSDKFEPPDGSWEDVVVTIDTIEEIETDSGSKQRIGYVTWLNGSKSRHDLQLLNMKCPHKMLAYYESHLVFKTREETDEANGDAQ